MNAAASELGKLAGAVAHQRSREPFWAQARKLCIENGLPIPLAINPPLILTLSDRLKGA